MIGIIVPSGDLLHADTAACLVQSVALLTINRVQCALINPKTSIVQKSRTIGVQQAIDAGCTHVMFIDSDMTFPTDTILKLLAHQKDVVGCYCPKRQEGGEIVGTTHKYGKPFTSKHKGLQKADTLGCAIMLIRTEVFTKTMRPWFDVIEEEDGRWQSEDEYFCYKVPYDIWCDCDLSKHIGHIGSKTFRSV